MRSAEFGVITELRFREWVREKKKAREGVALTLEELEVLYAEFTEDAARLWLREQLREAQGG